MPPERPPVDVVATIELTPEPQAPGWARRFISEFCAAAGLPEELCHTASLLTSELVTNAVLHGKSSATLSAHRPNDRLRVSVRDDNPALPKVGASPTVDAAAEGGRGLAIVAMLADSWGVEATDTGKAVWFELVIP